MSYARDDRAPAVVAVPESAGALTDTRFDWSLARLLWAIGGLAILSMLLAPLEAVMPPTLHLPWWAFRLLALVNPLLLTAILVAIGCWAAPRVGLDAPLVRALREGTGAGAVLRRQAVPAVLVGLFTAGVLFGYARLSAPWFTGVKVADVPMPLVAKLLYGGVVEELMTRWGLMSLFVWLAWKGSGARDPVPAGSMLFGAAVAALLFGAGHLPLLHAAVPDAPGALVAAVVIGNAIPGLLFGLLFWRRGLEAAMMAHAIGHLVFTLAG